MKRPGRLSRTTALRRRTRIKARGKRGKRFASYVRNEEFLAWIRTLPCIMGCRVTGSHPHHLTTRGAGGRDEGNVVPLCPHHHTEVHAMGRRSFAAAYPEVDLRVHAERLWAHHQTQEGR